MSTKPSSPISRFFAFVIPQFIALLFFVGFPAGWTAAVPVAYTKFERHDGRVTATSRVCLLFVIPYRQATIDPVAGIDDRFVGGSVTYDRSRRNHSGTKSEDQAYLNIHGEETSFEVPVSPANIKTVREQAEAFLKDESATELPLFTVANWKFGVFGGGLLSLLTVLYVGTIVFGLLLKVIHGIQRLCGVPPERRFLAKRMIDAEKNRPVI